MKRLYPFSILFLAAHIAAADSPVKQIRLTDLDLALVSQGWGEPQVDKACTEKPLCIAGKTYAKGLGSHAPGIMRFELDLFVLDFSARVGVDDLGETSEWIVNQLGLTSERIGYR